MEISSRSILILFFLAIVASVSVAFYSSVLAQDFEIYNSEDEKAILDENNIIVDDVELSDEVGTINNDTNSLKTEHAPIDFEQSEDNFFASPVSEDP